MLQKLEELRQELLLIPLSPKIELRLRWEGTINKIYWSLALSDNSLTKTEVVEILTSVDKKKLSLSRQEVLKYRKALDYIYQNWLASQRPITPRTIFTLYDIACFGRLEIEESDLKQVLDFVQLSSEHPVIKAAIIQIQLMNLVSLKTGDNRIARLSALLFLYKYGYDFKGFLVLEEYWRRNLSLFQDYTQNASRAGDLTLWLESFAQGIINHLQKILDDIKDSRFGVDLPPSFWELNDRQKEILSLLEQPGTSITNKKVQQMFKISQITASRDLTKLASLRLIFARGKGRSVHYTRV